MKGSPKIYLILSTLLLTAVFYSLYYTPLFIGKLILLMMLGALAESALILFQKKPLRAYGLGSAFAAGLLTCSLPDKMPIWQLLIGVLFASWIVKPLLPRIGIRLNSALAARLLLMLLFPLNVPHGALPPSILSAPPHLKSFIGQKVPNSIYPCSLGTHSRKLDGLLHHCSW